MPDLESLDWTKIITSVIWLIGTFGIPFINAKLAKPAATQEAV
jgi:hypothetical protein